MSIRTLVVDDDFRVASIHAAYVERVEGFSVIGKAHTAGDAIDAIASQKPDLVLMDIYLPDSNGLQVMQTITTDCIAAGEEAPDFIVITAARDVGSVRTAMQLGAVHYVVKPFGFASLKERLDSYASLRERLTTMGKTARQADVDAIFSMSRPAPDVTPAPPKGHSAPTLELVRNAVAAAPEDVSAAEVAEAVGISRATAQRYLTFLARHGLVKLQLKYGSTGRPEHRYQATGRP
ncbi:MAG TPA: response regulator [Marmoricola sp.]|nr:response regulator [Marmoricola sp.]